MRCALVKFADGMLVISFGRRKGGVTKNITAKKQKFTPIVKVSHRCTKLGILFVYGQYAKYS
jgi:hypothetical protein